MIKKLARGIGIGLTFVAAGAHAELNIVVLDTVRAILASDEAVVLAEAANKDMQKERESLQGMAEEIQALNNKLKTDGDVMSPSEKNKIGKDIEDLQIELNFGAQKLEKEAQDRRQEILQAIAPKFEKVLKDIIQVEQIDFVLQPNTITYSNSKHDITRRVTEELNEVGKGGDVGGGSR